MEGGADSLLPKWGKIRSELENTTGLSIIVQPEMRDFTTWKVGRESSRSGRGKR